MQKTKFASFQCRRSSQRRCRWIIVVFVGAALVGCGILRVEMALLSAQSLLEARAAVANLPAIGFGGESSRRQHLPWFILHLGPPKTGTSTIQKSIHAAADYLAKDNYVLAVRKVHRLFAANETALPADFVQRVQAAAANGQHVLLSDEALPFGPEAKRHIQALWELIRTNFNVQLVQTYRRYHEYLPSYYNQKSKKCQGGNVDRGGCNKWPSTDISTETDPYAAIPTFQEFFQRNFGSAARNNNNNKKHNNNNNQSFTFNRNRLEQNYNSFRKWKKTTTTFVSLHVFHMHQQGDLATNFICQMIPSATQACQFMKDKSSSSSSSSSSSRTKEINKAVALDYDRLAVCAKETSLIDAAYYTDRWQVAQKIQHYHENIQNRTDKDLPQTCPTPEMTNFIYEASLVLERKAFSYIYPNQYNKEDDWKVLLHPQHLQDFNQSWQTTTLDRQTMCNVDCPATLQTTEWKHFFAQEFPPPTTQLENKTNT